MCEDRGLEVSHGLAGAALRHAYRTPRHGFDCGGGEALDADEVARLVEVAADALANDRGPAMETIRMQVGVSIPGWATERALVGSLTQPKRKCNQSCADS